MLLESLKQFDWMNEPANVRFDEKGMNVIAKYRTDFWCCARYDFRKDDGHFFFSYVLGDFCCDLNWEFGLIALAFQAIFGKIKWPWFAALAFGLAVVAAAGAIVNYAANTSTKAVGFKDSLSGGGSDWGVEQ